MVVSLEQQEDDPDGQVGHIPPGTSVAQTEHWHTHVPPGQVENVHVAPLLAPPSHLHTVI